MSSMPTNGHAPAVDLDALADAPSLASMAVDVVDEQVGRLRDRGVDPISPPTTKPAASVASAEGRRTGWR